VGTLLRLVEDCLRRRALDDDLLELHSVAEALEQLVDLRVCSFRLCSCTSPRLAGGTMAPYPPT
jgi:hypothetical protein